MRSAEQLEGALCGPLCMAPSISVVTMVKVRSGPNFSRSTIKLGL
jgi:hypothetical protein